MSETKALSVTKYTGTSGFLTLTTPTHRETIEINHFLVAGRGIGCQLQIDDPFTSTRHFRIEKRLDRFFLTDLKSSNGTFINGVSICEAKLNDQDIIRIGETELFFSFQRDNKENTILRTSKSKILKDQLNKVPMIAQSQLPVMISGPSGSGKEIVAGNIHRYSQRSNGAFISVNCSALSESLIESELFGHVRGSFTGALSDRKGAFESARGGSLFLDEIGDLPLSLQPKLLRALENREIKPVGSDRSVHTDVRIIAASHKDLRQLVERGEFREDLFYRINVVNVELPSLADRKEDFEDFVFYFAKKLRVNFTHSAIQLMKRHSWPGNIRELKNMVAKSSALFPNQPITPNEVNALIKIPLEGGGNNPELKKTLPMIRQMEREIIIRALIANHGNQRQAATELGMPKSTLHDRVKHFNINAKAYRLKKVL